MSKDHRKEVEEVEENGFKRTRAPSKNVMRRAEKISESTVVLDEIDGKILLAYLRDSRSASREIAKVAGVSAATVIARTRRLEDRGVIRGYSAIVDHERIGYQLTVITEVTASQGKLVEIEKEAARLPNVCAVYDVTGATDFMIVAKFRNRQELSGFTKSLLSMPYVERTNTHVVLTTVKEDFRFPLMQERQFTAHPVQSTLAENRD
jgi:DNA-binding Lrp family transcriptional regulator